MDSTGLKFYITSHFVQRYDIREHIPNTEQIVGTDGVFWDVVTYNKIQEFGLKIDNVLLKDYIINNKYSALLQFRKFILTEVGLKNEIAKTHVFNWFFELNNERILEIMI